MTPELESLERGFSKTNTFYFRTLDGLLGKDVCPDIDPGSPVAMRFLRTKESGYRFSTPAKDARRYELTAEKVDGIPVYQEQAEAEPIALQQSVGDEEVAEAIRLTLALCESIHKCDSMTVSRISLTRIRSVCLALESSQREIARLNDEIANSDLSKSASGLSAEQAKNLVLENATLRGERNGMLLALEAIEAIVGDDFCEDLNCQTIHGIKNPELATCEQKISRVYSIAHAENPNHSCHHVHNDWRGIKHDVLRDVQPPATPEPPSQ